MTTFVGHHGDHLRGHAGNGDGIGDAGNLRVHLGQAAGDIGRQVLEQVAHADGGDHDAHAGRFPQGLVGRPLDDEAQKHRQDQHQGDGRRQGQAGGEVDHHQARHHEHVAVGEVNQAQDAVDHGIPNGDQGVLSAQGHAGEQNGNGVLHEGTLPCRFDMGHAEDRLEKGRTSRFRGGPVKRRCLPGDFPPDRPAESQI